MLKKKVVIGTRASILAIAQAEFVKKILQEKKPDLEIELKKIITSGDKDQRTNWGDTSLKSLFVKEIEKELLDGRVDIAVHSMKDMPAVTPKGLVNGCFPQREDNRDVLVSNGNLNLEELPEGAKVGTSSLRRKMSLLNLRPDLEVVPIRGNIHTRLKKLREGYCDAIILAAAGLKRVGMEREVSQYFETEEIVPAPAQGILCIQCREGDEFILDELKKVDDEKTRLICLAEREFSRIFDGGCHTPMGCSAEINGDIIELKGMYYSGDRVYFGNNSGSTKSPEKVAQDLAGIIRGKIDE